MKEKVKIVVVLVVILFIFLGIFFVGKKVSLNNYLNKTNKYSNKINYTTGITLNIESLDKQSKIEYTIARTKDIKNIIISKYDDEELTSSINKYLVKDEKKKNITWKIEGLNNNDLLEKLKAFVVYNLNKEAANTYECVFNVLFIDSNNNKGYNLLNYGLSNEFKKELNKILSPYIHDKEISFLK